MSVEACPICEATVLMDVGVVSGTATPREFHLCRCVSCQFVFVSDPRLDYGAIYSEDYYNGRGADTKLNYVGEIQHPARTVRRFEWRGVLERVGSLLPITPQTKWLDFGCGTGGLVDYLRSRSIDAIGFEQGWCLDLLRENGTPTVDDDDFDRLAGSFDVVSAIEVIEHTPDPVGMLRSIRRLLKPGGLLFMTTGNAEPYHDRITHWRYVTPEVHISYFEPSTLALALKEAEFEPGFPGYGSGWKDIIRYKLLMSAEEVVESVEAVVPWGLVARMIDWRLKLSAQPVGWARG